MVSGHGHGLSFKNLRTLPCQKNFMPYFPLPDFLREIKHGCGSPYGISQSGVSRGTFGGKKKMQSLISWGGTRGNEQHHTCPGKQLHISMYWCAKMILCAQNGLNLPQALFFEVPQKCFSFGQNAWKCLKFSIRQNFLQRCQKPFISLGVGLLLPRFGDFIFLALSIHPKRPFGSLIFWFGPTLVWCPDCLRRPGK